MNAIGKQTGILVSHASKWLFTYSLVFSHALILICSFLQRLSIMQMMGNFRYVHMIGEESVWNWDLFYFGLQSKTFVHSWHCLLSPALAL